jgi:hypothetical protein
LGFVFADDALGVSAGAEALLNLKGMALTILGKAAELQLGFTRGKRFSRQWHGPWLIMDWSEASGSGTRGHAAPG